MHNSSSGSNSSSSSSSSSGCTVARMGLEEANTFLTAIRCRGIQQCWRRLCRVAWQFLFYVLPEIRGLAVLRLKLVCALSSELTLGSDVPGTSKYITSNSSSTAATAVVDTDTNERTSCGRAAFILLRRWLASEAALIFQPEMLVDGTLNTGCLLVLHECSWTHILIFECLQCFMFRVVCLR